MECKICNNSKNLKEYKVKEMMFGFRDEFLYFQCEKCGCLQIAEIPANMDKYYPDNYYSYTNSNKQGKFNITRFLQKKRDNYAVFKKGLLGKWVYHSKPNELLSVLSNVPLTKDSCILDVGCGGGKLLTLLNEIGFTNLSGVDPYINEDISYDNGLVIQKKEVNEVKEKQDLIMFHHSFEHISNPLETLQVVSKLLNKGGYCIIRIPTASSYAWRHYKEKWVQLDAPRHFFLHSTESIRILAEKSSLEIVKIIYDSTAFQFLGSERYIKDIPLKNGVSDKDIFTDSEIENFKHQAEELNKNEDGDSCVFILKKI
ncbi:MAG: class I SAM-dependent methyltransferase [Vicingaceae bacterium]|nr:class I SAM-dependent methyltransferase [Vicingaceae bacterium]